MDLSFITLIQNVEDEDNYIQKEIKTANGFIAISIRTSIYEITVLGSYGKMRDKGDTKRLCCFEMW